MYKKIEKILTEVQKVILGKQDVIEKVLMAMLADGHVLLDDVPGVGKTSLAVALNKSLGLAYQRIQFTPGGKFVGDIYAAPFKKLNPLMTFVIRGSVIIPL